MYKKEIIFECNQRKQQCECLESKEFTDHINKANKETITKKVTHNSVKEVSLESDDGIGPTNEFPSSLLHKYNHTIYAASE